MPRCSFCKKNYEFPRGQTIILNDGTILHFCSSKCRKSWKMGRKPHKMRWIKKTKHTRAEEIAEAKQEVKEKQEAKEEKIEEKPEKKTEKKKEEKPAEKKS